MDFYGVNVQHGVDFFARDVYSSWLVVVGCSFVLIRLNVFGNFAAIGFDIQCTSFGSEGSDVVPSFIQWLQIQVRVSAKTQPNDMSFGLTPFISITAPISLV